MLKRIKCKGFKSIREMDLELGRINVLIGANGAGKSNLVELLRLLQCISDRRLQYYVRKKGGASNLLHYGSDATKRIELQVEFEWHEAQTDIYRCILEYTSDDSFFILEEEGWMVHGERPDEKANHFIEKDLKESTLDSSGAGHGSTTDWREVLGQYLAKTRAYHFNNTSYTSPLRRFSNGGLEHILEGDGTNLAGVLIFLKRSYPHKFTTIEETVRIIAPFFQSFVVEPEVENPNATMLRWRDVDDPHVFTASDLPDGLLRFIALTTLLTMPWEHRGAIVAIDEPELGLHPHAVEVMGALIDKASMESQIILATQSLNMLDQFDLENVIVVERKDGASAFTRPDVESKEHWLEDYALSDIWFKNILGGTP